MFGEGTLFSNSCPPGMMRKLDSAWLGPYLFVSLGEWPFSIRDQQISPCSVCPQVRKIVSSLPGPDRPELGYSTLLQSYITVLQSTIGHATALPSLLCVGAVPDAECHPAPLRDTVGCFPVNVGPVTCLDLSQDFAPGFISHPLDPMTLFRVLSVYRGYTTVITAGSISSGGIDQIVFLN